MFYIMALDGHDIGIIRNKEADGDMMFTSRKEAESFARDNCSEEWAVVEF